jgi:hypothetical protein
MTDNQKKIVTLALSLLFILTITIAIFCVGKIYSQEAKINSKVDTNYVNKKDSCMRADFKPYIDSSLAMQNEAIIILKNKK